MRRSAGPRKPKNLDQYTDLERAARGLEDFANDLRQKDAGTLVRWDLSVRLWHPDWEKKAR